MSASNQPLLTDVNGHFIPQIYNDSLQNYDAVKGQNGAGFTIPIGMNAKGHQTLAISPSQSASLTPPTGSMFAFISIEAAQCRYWVDGTSPTATQGHLVNDGDVIQLDSANQVTNFQIIGVSANAMIQVTYF